MRELNGNLASVTGLLANDPDEVANAVKDLNGVVGEVKAFVADNRETLGTTSDKLASVSQALTESLDDIKQVLHVAADVGCQTSSTPTSRPRARSAASRRSTTSPTRSRSCAGRYRPLRASAPNSRRNSASNTWRRS